MIPNIRVSSVPDNVLEVSKLDLEYWAFNNPLAKISNHISNWVKQSWLDIFGWEKRGQKDLKDMYQYSV